MIGTALGILEVIPDDLRQKGLNRLVDKIEEIAEKVGVPEAVSGLQGLKSDATFKKRYKEGWIRGIDKFLLEYASIDEDLVQAITSDKDVFLDKEVQVAILSLVSNPGNPARADKMILARSFVNVFRKRINRDRVDKAIIFLLECITTEIWHLPELLPIYNLAFQRTSAESAKELIQLQKDQIGQIKELNTSVQSSLLQLSHSLAEQSNTHSTDLPYLPIYDSVKHNLPRSNQFSLVGRESEFESILALLSPRTRQFIIGIEGLGGIGKSTLALKLAHYYVNEYEHLAQEDRFEAIVWMSAKSSVLSSDGIINRSPEYQDLEDIFSIIAICFERDDILKGTSQDSNLLIRDALARQRTLLIFDNFESIEDSRVINFLQEAPEPTKILITTRIRLSFVYSIRLKNLNEIETRQIVGKLLDERKLSLPDSDIASLFILTAGLPLAIVWSIAQLDFGYSVEEIKRRFDQFESDFVLFCFGELVRQIKTTQAYAVFLATSLFITDASREALGFVGNISDDFELTEALIKLEKLSLIDRVGRRYKLQPIAKILINRDLEGAEKQKELLIKNWCDFYISFSSKGWTSTKADLDLVDVEFRNIAEALEYLIRFGQIKQSLTIIEGLFPYFMSRGKWREWQTNLERLRELVILQKDEQSFAKVLYWLGYINVLKREAQKAKRNLQTAKKIFEQLDNRLYVTKTNLELARAFMFDDEYKLAASILKSCESSKSPDLSLLYFIRLGEFNFELGQLLNNKGSYVEAQKLFERAEKNFLNALQIQNPSNVSYSLNFIYWRLGAIVMERKDLAKAKEYLNRSLTIAKDLKIQNGIALATGWLATLHEKMGDDIAAILLGEEAMAQFEILHMLSHKEDMVQLVLRLKAIEQN